MVIRSEFSGVKAGDHVYGILREFLSILFTKPRIQYPILNVCVYISPWKRSKISSSGITWSILRYYKIHITYLGRRSLVFSGCRVSPRSTIVLMLLHRQPLSRRDRLHGLAGVF